MKITLRACLSTKLALFLFTSPLYAQFYTLETKNLRLIYVSRAQDFVVPHVARCFENAYAFHTRLFDFQTKEKVTVLLQDFGDFAGGGAGTVPKNLVIVGLAPFSYVYETMTANERINLIMNHEVGHVVTLDKASGPDNFFRSLFFGKVSPTPEDPISIFYSHLTSPRTSSSRWYIEGIAVFLETWMGGGLGRALSSYDEMVFRTMVRDSSHIYDVVGLESEGTKVDFQVGANSYLYGTRFVSYLANQYGPDKLLQWISRSRGSKAYFASQFKNVYGVALDEEWARWITWEHHWQQANLDSLRLNPTTPHRPLSRRALGSVSRAFFDAASHKIYAAINYPGQIAHLASIDVRTGMITRLHDIKGAAIFYVSSLAYDPASKTIFYTTDNNGWRDLHAFEVNSGRSQMLIKDVRTGDLAFNQADQSIWGVRHFNGISTLVRIPQPYKEWKQVYSFPYGNDIFDIDVSPDGKLITGALAEVDGKQRLIKMDVGRLLNGESSYEILFDFEISTPANFTFTSDGKFLIGSSYYSGVSNIYQYDFEKQDMSALSNSETGFFRPIPIADDSLIVFCYTGKGFLPAMIGRRVVEKVSAINFLGSAIAASHPLVRSWLLPSPASINLDSLKTVSGTYSSLGNMRLASAYPIVEGYKDYTAIGMRFNFSDYLNLSGVDLAASYAPASHLPNDERLHARLNIRHWGWHMSAAYNGADFYDLFGPTKTSRKGYSVALHYKKNLLYDEPRTLDINARIAGYGGLEKLPDYQNVAASFDKFYSLSAGLSYQYLRKSLGAVDEEKGVKWEIAGLGNYVNEDFFPRIYSSLDYGIPLAINHSSIWLRSAAGYSFGDRDEPFANFFFGGFGNNWVDHLSERRYREYYSFPGVALNNISGTNFGKLLVEWTLPPIRFRRAGFLSLYSNWTQVTLFSSGIVTNLESDRARRRLFNIGGQMDFKLVIFSRLESTFSFGYAVAREKNRNTDEFMISLKLLK